MKTTKRILALTLCIFAVAGLSACGNKTPEEETGTVRFESLDEAYEAMTGAALEGDYRNAVRYYNSGAANAEKNDVRSWYLYSVAMENYEKDGCIGYPLDVLQNQVGESFFLSNAMIGTLQNESRNFNGCYFNGNYYLYLVDGKVAVSDMTELTVSVITDGELVKRNGVYYWAQHHADGDDTLLYTITSVDTGYELTAVEGATDSTYSGIYTPCALELPVLYY